MILVERFAIQDRFHRRSVIVYARLFVASGKFGDMAVLSHVEVQPIVGVKPGRGTIAAGRMECDQVASAVSGPKPSSHRANHGFLFLVIDVAIAAVALWSFYELGLANPVARRKYFSRG